MHLLLWVREQTKSGSPRVSRTRLIRLRRKLGKDAKTPGTAWPSPG